MTKWFYIGSDLNYGAIYIDDKLTTLKINIYNPDKKKREFFTLKPALSFIYLLKLDKLINSIKDKIPKLYEEYINFYKKCQFFKGTEELFKILNIPIEELQKLYNNILPIVRKRINKNRIPLRTILPLNFLKPKGEIRNVMQYFKVVIVNTNGKEDLNTITRKCYTIFKKLKFEGKVKAKSIKKIIENPLKISFTTRLHSETLLNKHKNYLLKKIENKLRKKILENLGFEKYFKNLLKQVKKNLNKNNINNMIENIDYSDYTLIKITLRRKEKMSIDYSCITFFYNKGKIFGFYYEPIGIIASFKVLKDGKVKFIK